MKSSILVAILDWCERSWTRVRWGGGPEGPEGEGSKEGGEEEEEEERRTRPSSCG